MKKKDKETDEIFLARRTLALYSRILRWICRLWFGAAGSAKRAWCMCIGWLATSLSVEVRFWWSVFVWSSKLFLPSSALVGSSSHPCNLYKKASGEREVEHVVIRRDECWLTRKVFCCAPSVSCSRCPFQCSSSSTHLEVLCALQQTVRCWLLYQKKHRGVYRKSLL